MCYFENKIFRCDTEQEQLKLSPGVGGGGGGHVSGPISQNRLHFISLHLVSWNLWNP